MKCKLMPLDEAHLDRMQALWNEELGQALPMRQRLLRQTVFEDENLLHEGSWAAEDPASGRLIGFVVAKHPGTRLAAYGISSEHGWIHSLLVAQAARGRGIGGELLRRAEGVLAARGARRIQLGNDLYSRLAPGLPAELEQTRVWLERRGYAEEGTVYDMRRAYAADVEVALPELGETQATMRLATPQDREAMTAFMARCFPGAWDYQHRAYWERGGTGREYVVLEHGGEPIGFCRINDADSPLLAQNIYWAPLFEQPLGGIGPLGIDERYRGHRYGIKIVQAGIHFLLHRGCRAIVIDTTPFVDFYGKLGYETWRAYVRYAKAMA
ncbi:GNAT family N-acetyltransferase [Paenibacillus sp. IB182496]|uniref:GNAT family N-acetyltransferase n=1 Tax=Paenibacillus sabuli TaxID=2772509 RepID=A0A927BXF6_9BACL|nr:GNAT family N-acetyltransferase [Paenibacillus sabuli]MBD2847118.1 GNAT family N-acetyltransferase [Paenibacillus sabuli]